MTKKSDEQVWAERIAAMSEWYRLVNEHGGYPWRPWMLKPEYQHMLTQEEKDHNAKA